ncbi:MAG: HlyD family efflux transporter periplasmic adaptor subunit [Proteobacteria bacterium]|uniref:HlyD family efflux transporter periplasmic adaptor subunit n=1 Tax=Candidatus Avisuccinivibrio stercorigallinarum TaxID=2840704 RepID=A0A9D9DBU2_9GAMM|nr:HlyD family efflux transporter periplasmic adaptor subunit [Candidatus Avisuccinivibrio stercorigallinarum]
MPAKKLAAAVIAAAAAAAAGALVYLNLAAEEGSRSYGFIDLRESALAFEISGRISALYADEGQHVQKGQLLAALDTQDLQHQLYVQQASCAVTAAELYKLEQGYRPELTAAAKAQVQKLSADLKLREAAAQRLEKLYRQKAASAQDRDDAVFSRDSAAAALQAQQAQLQQYQNGYEAADIEAKRRSLQQCRAQEQYLTYKIERQSRLYAPYSGLLRTRLMELGAMATVQSPVFYLSDVSEKKVRFYLPELEVSKVHPGEQVTVENAAGQRLRARVSAVSESAMFTPKNVQTEDLRPDLMYEVTALMADAHWLFRLGQAVTIYLDGGAGAGAGAGEGAGAGAGADAGALQH